MAGLIAASAGLPMSGRLISAAGDSAARVSPADRRTTDSFLIKPVATVALNASFSGGRTRSDSNRSQSYLLLALADAPICAGMALRLT